MSNLGFRFVLLTLSLLLISNITQAAETTASIIGTVYDDKNAEIPGVTVTAVNAATNFTRVTTTESSGFYRVALLPPGTYAITVELAGFAKEVRKGIELSLGHEIVLDVRLKLS